LLQNIKDNMLPYGENPKCLSHLGLQRYRDVTDTKLDTKTARQNHQFPIANTRYSCASSRA